MFAGTGRDTVTSLARMFAANAATSEGPSMIIVGANTNHWYSNNLATTR